MQVYTKRLLKEQALRGFFLCIYKKQDIDKNIAISTGAHNMRKIL